MIAKPPLQPHATNDRVVLGAVGVGKEYPTADGSLTALSAVDLNVREGEFVSLVGPSGCGKSTLLNILGGLLDATSGIVTYRGQPHAAARREIGMMFQAPVLLPWRTILANVMLPGEVLHLDRHQHKRHSLEMLELVGLKGFENSYPRQLSGGMQQRAALSRVLSYDPEVLLLDEPFGALDEFTREAMNLELQRICSDGARTVVFVTHNITEAVFLADRVVAMSPRPGRVAGVVGVDLARPRTRETMRMQAFTDLVFEVRDLLGVAR